jgi:BirA family biotin operon repressor/biotin-[acetyl-CoA-carboxylase] ligase
MTQPAPPGWRLQTHAELASTQDAAMQAAGAGDPGRLAILAYRQTAGRGRSGRAWAAPPGNLNLSVLLRPAGPAADAGRFALLSGLALHHALAPYTAGLMLKWPNDLLLHGAKLGGILIDSQVGPHGALDWLVIGFGANLATAPHVPGRNTACLPSPADPSQVAAQLLAALDAHAGMDMPAIAAAWTARAHKPGTWLDVHTPRNRVSGKFAGLSADGALLLEGGGRPVACGEVFLKEEERVLF